MTNKPKMFNAAKALFPAMRDWRRTIHAHPELGFKEKKTAALVAGVLRKNGWQVKTSVAGTGVVGLLGNPRSGKVMAIRADMDALPVQEKNSVAYRSSVPGVMHACGHDGNTTIALGAACILSEYKKKLNGQVKLIFQPCEEQPPGGAKAMIEKGVLNNPSPQFIIAGHMDAQLPLNRIGLKDDVIMANADAFSIIVNGKGGHGAMPHQCVDPIPVAAQIITNLQHVISRENNPLTPQVITIGQVEGGTAYNVIADQVMMKGTIRSLSKKERKNLPVQIKRIASRVAKAHRARAEFVMEEGHPALVNHVQVTGRVREAVWAELGKKGIVEFKYPAMSGEDFTYYSEQRPACFFHVGAAFAEKNNYPWHHPEFDFDERALIGGACVLARTAWDYLK